MKILLTGARGQLGQELIKSSKNYFKKEELELIVPSKNDLNFLSHSSLIEKFITKTEPDWIINAAAYTAVDKAEEEPELAYKVNSEAPKSIARALSKHNGKLIQISTDFVFSGEQNYPYQPDQKINPVCTYGLSKGLGEKYILEILKENSYVIRTSWLYGPVGNNFLLTMLKLHEARGKNNEFLKVVYDQISCPTSTSSLAILCWNIISRNELKVPNILHWSNLGVCSWYDFAYEIGTQGLEKNIIKNVAKVIPIRSKDYPSLAKRPNYSLLDCVKTREFLKIPSKHWKEELSHVLDDIKSQKN